MLRMYRQDRAIFLSSRINTQLSNVLIPVIWLLISNSYRLVDRHNIILSNLRPRSIELYLVRGRAWIGLLLFCAVRETFWLEPWGLAWTWLLWGWWYHAIFCVILSFGSILVCFRPVGSQWPEFWLLYLTIWLFLAILICLDWLGLWDLWVNLVIWFAMRDNWVFVLFFSILSCFQLFFWWSTFLVKRCSIPATDSNTSWVASCVPLFTDWHSCCLYWQTGRSCTLSILLGGFNEHFLQQTFVSRLQ